MGMEIPFGLSRATTAAGAMLMLVASTAIADENGVAALGRIEPEGGIIRIAAPSTPLSLAGSVVLSLHVREGEDVEAGQRLAVTDAEPALKAAVRLARTELEMQRRAANAARSRADEACVTADVARREAERREQLLQRDLASREEVEQSRGEATARAATCAATRADIDVADAGIEVATATVALREAEWQRAFVPAPHGGRVLRILSHPGEYVGADGILELGRVDRMYAIAEVYETDIHRVAPGMKASVASEALGAPLSGTVEFIRPKVQKQDEIGTDPAARKDARIIEVGIALEDDDAAASLTNLQVEVLIRP